MAKKEYRYLATSEAGFIRQIVNYVRHGYVFYVKGSVREGLDPKRVDEKLLALYDVRKTDDQRYWRKKHGQCNFQYLRFQSTWVLLLTHGEQPDEFAKREAKNVRNLERGEPLVAFGYSITRVAGQFLKSENGGEPVRDTKKRVRVQIAKPTFRSLKARLLSHARNRSEDWYRLQFYHLGFEPYAPIRKQMLELLRLVNAARSPHGLSKIKPDCTRYRIEPVKVFEPVQKAA